MIPVMTMNRCFARSYPQKPVTLYRWPGEGELANVYQHCIDHHRGKARWIAYVDDDEFLFPATAKNLPQALCPYELYAGVACCWLLFGSNGHKTRPRGLVTHSYRKRGDWVDQVHCEPGEGDRARSCGSFIPVPAGRDHR